MSSKHTKEPWRVEYEGCDDHGDLCVRPSKPSGGLIAAFVKSILFDTKERNANAERAVACVNAMAGIPTADLPSLTAALERERELRGILGDAILEFKEICDYTAIENAPLRSQELKSICDVVEKAQAALAKTRGV